jgi:hypothetical protein
MTHVTSIVETPRQVDTGITAIFKRTIVPPLYPIPICPLIQFAGSLGIVKPE